MPTDSPYPGSAGSSTRIVYQNASPSNGQPGTCKITASDGGPVTAHMSWNGGTANIPAPSAAIVMETSTGTYNATVGDSPDFVWKSDPTAGLGAGVTLSGYQDSNGNKSFTGTKYSAATSGGDSTTTCSPNFVLSGTTGVNGDSYEYCSLRYTYAAFKIPITMKLDGTTPDSSGNLNILVGQGCTASIVGIPTDSHTTYSWTVAGTTFQSWNGESKTTPVTAITGPGHLDQPTAHWFWSDTAGNKTVTCTATVTPPIGEGSQYTLTVTQQVNLQVPVVQKNTNSTGLGYVGLYNSTTTFGMFAGATPLMKNNGQEDGSTWTTSISLPSVPNYGSTGAWGYAQLTRPGEYVTGDDGQQIQSTDTATGETGLDGVFPYASTHVPDGNSYNDGDTPALDILSDLLASVELDDTFYTYLMFRPPTAASAATPDDVQWVPLAQSVWSTSLHASRPADKHWSSFPLNTSVGPVNLGSNFISQTTHPSWTRVFAKGTPFIHN